MKLLALLIISFSIFSCTPSIYGVSKNNWDILSPSERQQVIAHHQEMETLREQRRTEEAKIALEKEKYLQQELEVRQQQADKIYAGQSGIQGDLLRVTIFGGQVLMRGKHRRYSPVSLRIADGEQKTVLFHHPEKRRYQTDIIIKYYDGLLTFDDAQGQEENYSYPIAYIPEWRKGKQYSNISLNKRSHSEARNINIVVDAIRLPRRHD